MACSDSLRHIDELLAPGFTVIWPGGQGSQWLLFNQ